MIINKTRIYGFSLRIKHLFGRINSLQRISFTNRQYFASFYYKCFRHREIFVDRINHSVFNQQVGIVFLLFASKGQKQQKRNQLFHKNPVFTIIKILCYINNYYVVFA